MLAAEFHRRLHEALGPAVISAGFRRKSSSPLKYVSRDGRLTAWAQIAKAGWDTANGGSFTFELEFFAQDESPRLPPVRSRFHGALDEGGLDELRDLNNLVIGSLPPIPAEHFIHHAPPDLRRWFESRRRPDTERYSPRIDHWIRYHTPDDVRRAGEFLGRVLPRLVANVLATDEERRSA